MRLPSSAVMGGLSVFSVAIFLAAAFMSARQLRVDRRAIQAWKEYQTVGRIGPYRTDHPYLPIAKDQPSPRRDAAWRVACIGGSTTYAPTYPLVLEAVLLASGVDASVVNYGAETYTSLDSAVNMLVRGTKERLTHVVVYHAINDAAAAGLMQEGETFDAGYEHVRRRASVDSSQPHPTLAAAFRMDRKTGTVNIEQSTDAFVLHMRSLCGVAVAHGMEVLLVTQFHRADVSRNTWNEGVAALVESFNAALPRVAENLPGVHVYDVVTERPDIMAELYDSCHMTPKGYALLGQAIAGRLKREKK